MNYHRLEWDSAFFGLAIGRVEGDAVAAASEADAAGSPAADRGWLV